MPIAVAGQNAAVNAVTALITHFSILNESLVEISGGSYARHAVAWGGAVGGLDDQNDDELMNIPGGVTIAFVGFENNISTGDGKTVGWWPLGGMATQAGVANLTADNIASDAHGLVDTNRVVCFGIAGGGLPAGLTLGLVYWVVGAAANTFQVALTSGGAPVNITANGELLFSQCVPETFGAAGTYLIAAGDVDILATLI